jgi:hypothetical protein
VKINALFIVLLGACTSNNYYGMLGGYGDVTGTPDLSTSGSSDQHSDNPNDPHDLSVVWLDLSHGPLDLAEPAHDLANPLRSVGDPCTSKTQCAGPNAHCLPSDPANTANPIFFPGGYCSKSCTVGQDSDCGTDSNGNAVNNCMNFGTAASPVGLCVKGCSAASDCRGGSYVCSFIGGGACLGGGNLDCAADNGDGSCMTTAFTDANGVNHPSVPGGCLRDAVGSGVSGLNGLCTQKCAIGTSTCPSDSSGNPYVCIVEDQAHKFTDGSLTGDKWVGPVCQAKVMIPGFTLVSTGLECLSMAHDYLDICIEADECDLRGTDSFEPWSSSADNRCHPLCYLSGGGAGTLALPSGAHVAGACPTGTTCNDIWKTTGASDVTRRVGLCK